MLTKSNYLKGRQCARRLWLAVHGPLEPAIDSDDLWEMREEDGREVEEVAESTFPGIVLITAKREDALAQTVAALAQRRPIAQARFEVDGLASVTDILEPRDAGWFLWEVKASTATFSIHHWDVAFQVEVARRAGIDVVGAGVIRIDKSYVRGHEIEPTKLLFRDDVTAITGELTEQVRSEIQMQLEAVSGSAMPAAQPASHCNAGRRTLKGNRPSSCGHREAEGVCGQALPRYWAGHLPDLKGEQKWARVLAMPNPSIDQLDPDDRKAKWTLDQQRCIRAVKSGVPVVDSLALGKRLDELTWPVAYLDFEFDTSMAVPRFAGCRPYETLPFQWSMLVQDERGSDPREIQPFLHLEEGDPRAPFSAALLAALPDEGSIVAHYASAEIGVIEYLAQVLGGTSAERLRTLKARFFDTHALAKDCYCHADQLGCWSIKALAPVLVGQGYGDLEIKNGLAAVAEWRSALAKRGAEREKSRRDLLAYCGRDTALMHAMIEALREHAPGAR